MNSKEKKIIIIFIILFVILLIVYISSNLSIKGVYAQSQKNMDVKFSKMQDFDIDNVIKQNNKINSEQIITEEIEIEYITEYENNDELPKETIQVIQEGRTGKQQVTKKITIDENSEKKEEEISSIIITNPVNKIVQIGTSKSKKSYKISKGNEVYITSDMAEVKRDSDYNSSRITILSRNTILKVLDIKDGWCKIFKNGQYGWIRLENVALKINNTGDANISADGKITYDIEMALNKPSGLSLNQFNKVLTDENDKNNIFRENSEYFYYIENEYNINGVFVAAIGIHESGWGKSNITINKKNIFGYRAYDSSPYNSASTFNSYAEGIDLIARVLVKYYLNPKGTIIYNGEKAIGTYYNGNTIKCVNQKYASDSNWANKVYNYMVYLYKKI